MKLLSTLTDFISALKHVEEKVGVLQSHHTIGCQEPGTGQGKNERDIHRLTFSLGGWLLRPE